MSDRAGKEGRGWPRTGEVTALGAPGSSVPESGGDVPRIGEGDSTPKGFPPGSQGHVHVVPVHGARQRPQDRLSPVSFRPAHTGVHAHTGAHSASACAAGRTGPQKALRSSSLEPVTRPYSEQVLQ